MTMMDDRPLQTERLFTGYEPVISCLCGKPDPPQGRDPVPGLECQHLPFRGSDYTPRRDGLKPKVRPPEPEPMPESVDDLIAKVTGNWGAG